MPCSHTILHLTPSPFAPLAGFSQPNTTQLAAAQELSGRVPKNTVPISPKTFPAPLVLPHDDLNYDPDCPAQSTRSWVREKARNKLTKDNGRDTLYVARVPSISKDVTFMRGWIEPVLPNGEEKDAEAKVASPDITLFTEYLSAFYYGMDVRVFPEFLSWTAWGAKKKQPNRAANLPPYVGLAYGENCTRVRVRRPPDGVFAAQLNLDDIIDAAIAMLPEDAYALCLLVDHDIYENDDDDFCCGRAYGGSRVAVVQSARYRPSLDGRGGIMHDHVWPFSHCKAFVDQLCAVEDLKPKPASKKQIEWSRSGPMREAIRAAATEMNGSSRGSQQATQALWFSRLARTVSHELGHCFGMAHCVYFACNMQGTAGMEEDVRQPPYACPICEAKIGHAICEELCRRGEQEKEIWIRQRCEALRAFCSILEEKGVASGMWRGLDAWLRERLTIMDSGLS